MSTKRVRATCIVEIQVECDSNWSGDTTMEQILKQAEAEATIRIQRVFSDAATPDDDMVLKRRNRAGLGLIGVTSISTRAISER